MDTVWQSILDEIYEYKVERTGEVTDQLTVSDNQNSRLLLDKDVQLSHGSMFDSDMGDVAYWMDMCVTVVGKMKE
jgi:hypothetical protein